MTNLLNFVTELAPTVTTLGLIGVTVWYAVQTQKMARSARDAAESSRQAAEYSARSAAIAAAGVRVDFHIGPVYAIGFDFDGLPFKGVRIECSEASVYVHDVVVGEAWALDPAEANGPTSYTTIEIFAEGKIPPVIGLESSPVLMHRHESTFLEFDSQHWTECEPANLTVDIDYSFDGLEPLRRRTIEWQRSDEDF
ncbi:hypothetical protein [Cryobacterium sp. TMT4-31]|uniref:hypothetical protein n=1 Tax=Cryobacterium sp. TMT4-31 TaxID=1259259 RepID=UPI00106C639F|nr:hypothetical protein [Cryobacterium sp. TMT4-31]TFC87448.1 hypothetical protein E3T19_12495 [Cryobacterium sp. TMT4-31]